jgi:hypothetical protein
MKALLPKILFIILLLAATVAGFILLISRAKTHSPILILGAALFLFGSWGAVALLDSLFKHSTK